MGYFVLSDQSFETNNNGEGSILTGDIGLQFHSLHLNKDQCSTQHKRKQYQLSVWQLVE